MTKQELSVLIPNYNYVCVPLIRQLVPLLQAAAIDYEVIVADDGSPDKETIQANQVINEIPHCQYIVKPTNTGSASTRNFLATQSRFRWLLFLDADISIPSDLFVKRYLESPDVEVVNGGICIVNDAAWASNLRYRYEKEEEPRHSADRRQQNCYQAFRSTNFLIDREAFRQCPFDERFRMSGYEDVLFGKHLKQQRIAVTHIDNPVQMTTFESNPDYVVKTERSLRTLHQFRDDLRGYSRLLTFVGNIHIPAILWLIRLWHRLFGALERRNLCGSHPSLTIFKLYRLGYFICSCG